MTETIIFIIVVVLLIIVLYLFTRKKKKSTYREEIEDLIEAVSADGVFTPNEKTVIGKIADKFNVDKEEVFKQIEQRIKSSVKEAETELVNPLKKRGDDFEKFVIKKFDKKLFTIKQWASDKYIEGLYSEKTRQPDIILEFNYNNYQRTIAVECKWRNNYYKGGAQIAYNLQFKHYKEFERKQNMDVYIALGIGGQAANPESFFLIPLKGLEIPFITAKTLTRYKQPTNNSFYLNMKTGSLEIRE